MNETPQKRALRARVTGDTVTLHYDDFKALIAAYLFLGRLRNEIQEVSRSLEITYDPK